MHANRPITFLAIGVATIMLLALAMPKVANSLSFQAEQPPIDIFLPIIDTGNDGSQDNNATPSAFADGWAVPHEYLILWRTDADNGQPSTAPLNYDILDLSSLWDSGMEANVEAILESYRNNPNVALIEPNYVYTATLIPNDPRQAEQYAWELMNGYDAWDLTLGNAETVIAVIDTGVDLDHPDLVDKIVAGFDFVGRDDQADDENFHGTHVAGTSAASTDNELDGAGTCPNCSIMPVRALNAQGSGSLADIAAAINFATDNGAEVINMSLGASVRSAILEQAVNRAWDSGVFVTCAAGNDNTDELSFPAGFDKCVSVASTNQVDQRSGFSNFGATVELAAPGSNILSTFPDGQTNSISGTSMATPHVAGLAGLLSSLGLTNEEIRDRLCETAVAITGTGTFWQCGRIDMLAAVSIEGTGQDPTATPPPTSTPLPTATSTPLPTPTPTATPDPADPEWDPPLRDGGFEEGAIWTYSDPAIRSTERPLNGQFSAQLGGENNTTDLAEQTVLIPANGILSYTWRAAGVKDIYGYEGKTDAADDLLLEFDLLDGSGATFFLRHSPRQDWVRPTIDVSSLAGKSVTIRFRAVTDGEQPTFFFVDDVGLGQ